jgi:hypothetical protein
MGGLACVAEDADAMRAGMRHVEDYFARRPPFSTKKAEFPDAGED